MAQKVCESRGSHVVSSSIKELCATLYNVVHLGAAVAQYDVVSRHLLAVVKVKVTLEQATKSQKGSRRMALLFLQPRR